MVRNCTSMSEDLKKLTKNIEMTNIGIRSYYLSIKVKPLEEGIFISQKWYTREIWEKFKIANPKFVRITPTEIETKSRLSFFRVVTPLLISPMMLLEG